MLTKILGQIHKFDSIEALNINISIVVQVRLIIFFVDYFSRCRGRIGGGEEESRFGYPRFRASGRHHGALFAGAVPPGPGGVAVHAPHAPHVPLGAHSPHARMPDDDALYETADAERLRDAPDSER